MPSSLIRIISVAAMLLAAQLTGRSQGVVPRTVPVAPGYQAQPGYAPQQERMQVVDPDKKLSTGDMLTVEIVEDREGGFARSVTAAGELEVPPVGRIKVAGKTTTEASANEGKVTMNSRPICAAASCDK